MQHLNPIDALIDHWPSREAFANEVGASVDAVHKWAQNGRIPTGYQAPTVRAAAALGVTHATAEWMLAVHDRSTMKAEAANG